MLLAVRLSSYGYTWEVSRALKKLELLINSYASLALSKLSRHIHNSIYSLFTHVASIYANLLEHQHGRPFNVLGQQYGRHDVK